MGGVDDERVGLADKLGLQGPALFQIIQVLARAAERDGVLS
jgi:hypothetical protein